MFKTPELNANAFTCPHCGVFSQQRWTLYHFQTSYQRVWRASPFHASTCEVCGRRAFWFQGSMIIPEQGLAPLPVDDMPENVKELYLEARGIVSKSPKGAAALLRLAAQFLCNYLCEELGYGKQNMNDAIAAMVKDGLPERTQKALDAIRVTGNHAVHPGLIDFDDKPDVADKLFPILNFIIEKMVTEPKAVDDFFEKTVPEKDKENIKKRDKKKPTGKSPEKKKT